MKAMTTSFEFPIATHCSIFMNGGHPKSAHQSCLWCPLSLLWLINYCGPVTSVIIKALKMTDNPASN
jgi:hypothetical protein